MKSEDMQSQGILQPVKIDKGGPWYSVKDVNKMVAMEYASDTPISTTMTRSEKNLINEKENIVTKIEQAIHEIGEASSKWQIITKKMQEDMKASVSKIKDMQTQLSISIANVQKNITHSDLDRLVSNSERLVIALTTLSELNKNPNLSAIIELLGSKK